MPSTSYDQPQIINLTNYDLQFEFQENSDAGEDWNKRIIITENTEPKSGTDR